MQRMKRIPIVQTPRLLLWVHFLVILLCRTVSIQACGSIATMAFATKSKRSQNNKKKNQASTTRGFGAKPPTFEEVVAKFKTRVPPKALDMPCPCCQEDTNEKQLYQDCCAPYHEGTKLPESPERVLRSRYSAFQYRLIPYILQTTHPKCGDFSNNKIQWAKDMNADGMFDSYEFHALEIVGDQVFSEDNPNEAFLQFQVKLRSTTGDGQVSETLIKENSRFLNKPITTNNEQGKEEGGWLYVNAVDGQTVKLPQNEP